VEAGFLVQDNKEVAGAGLGDLQDLHGLLVLRAADGGELRQDLRAVIKKCRPDWDITTPEMKAAWQQGRKEFFYPYGKTFAETIGEQE
jgi:hypothetical protein